MSRSAVELLIADGEFAVGTLARTAATTRLRRKGQAAQPLSGPIQALRDVTPANWCNAESRFVYRLSPHRHQHARMLEASVRFEAVFVAGDRAMNASTLSMGDNFVSACTRSMLAGLAQPVPGVYSFAHDRGGSGNLHDQYLRYRSGGRRHSRILDRTGSRCRRSAGDQPVHSAPVRRREPVG